MGTKFVQISGVVGSRDYEYAQQLLSSFFSFTRQEKQTSAEEGMERYEVDELGMRQFKGVTMRSDVVTLSPLF